MEIKKEFFKYCNRATFDTALASGKITDDMFVLIEDEKTIYAHGIFYGESEIYTLPFDPATSGTMTQAQYDSIANAKAVMLTTGGVKYVCTHISEDDSYIRVRGFMPVASGICGYVMVLVNKSNRKYNFYSYEPKLAESIAVQDITNEVSNNSGGCSLDPNVYYIVTGQSMIDVSLNTPADTTIYNEYLLEFTTPSGGTSLVITNSVKWHNGESPIIEGGKTYQLSIVNNLAICGEFA